MPVYLQSHNAQQQHTALFLNLRIISHLVIRLCYQDNSIAPASSLPKPVRTTTVSASEIPIDENKINIDPRDFDRGPSSLDDPLFQEQLNDALSAVVEYDKPVKWRELLFPHCGHICTLVFLTADIV